MPRAICRCNTGYISLPDRALASAGWTDNSPNPGRENPIQAGKDAKYRCADDRLKTTSTNSENKTGRVRQAPALLRASALAAASLTGAVYGVFRFVVAVEGVRLVGGRTAGTSGNNGNPAVPASNGAGRRADCRRATERTAIGFVVPRRCAGMCAVRSVRMMAIGDRCRVGSMHRTM